MNKVFLVGGLGNDVELRYMNSGTALASFSLATKSYNSATKQEDSVWHAVKLWGKSAESFATHAGKGSRVALLGELTYERYTDKDGHEKQKTVIKCFEGPEIISGFKKKDESGSSLATQLPGNTAFQDDLDIPF